jgi:hypothetical protein
MAARTHSTSMVRRGTGGVKDGTHRAAPGVSVGGGALEHTKRASLHSLQPRRYRDLHVASETGQHSNQLIER